MADDRRLPFKIRSPLSGREQRISCTLHIRSSSDISENLQLSVRFAFILLRYKVDCETPNNFDKGQSNTS